MELSPAEVKKNPNSGHCSCSENPKAANSRWTRGQLISVSTGFVISAAGNSEPDLAARRTGDTALRHSPRPLGPSPHPAPYAGCPLMRRTSPARRTRVSWPVRRTAAPRRGRTLHGCKYPQSTRRALLAAANSSDTRLRAAAVSDGRESQMQDFFLFFSVAIAAQQ